MIIKQYIKDFENLGFGMFVHFGLYSMLGTGEWSKHSLNIADEDYELLKEQFEPKKNWATELVKTAKNAGCKYITLTTRHHDGFSLYDTCGLNDYDAPHSKCGRDLVIIDPFSNKYSCCSKVIFAGYLSCKRPCIMNCGMLV